MPAFLVLFDFPTGRSERGGIAVNDVLHQCDGGVTAEGLAHISEKTFPLAEHLDFLVRPVFTSEGRLQFACLIDIELDFAHRHLLCCDSVQYELRRVPVGSSARFAIAGRGLKLSRFLLRQTTLNLSKN